MTLAKSTDYDAKLKSLKQRNSEIDGRLAKLADKHREMSLDAANGNKASVKAIQELAAESDRLRQEQHTLTIAVEQVERLQREQARQIEIEDRRQREAEARRIVDCIRKANGDIDRGMVALCKHFETRADYFRQLGRTRVVNSSLILRQSQKHGPTAAAHAAGLRDYIGLDHISPQQVRTLADSAGSLGDFKLPTDETVTV